MGTGEPGIGPQLPERPANVEFASIRELYLGFEAIFLARSLIVSPCGHQIHCFEHHFFHMAGILVDGIDGIPELSMRAEKPTILATEVGFAHYQIIEGGARGRHLRSAYETLTSPDEVWEGNPRFKNARWGYIKEYSSKPRPFSLALVGEFEHPRSTILVPYSSFPVRQRDIKKWRQGTRIYRLETPTATPEE